MAALKRSGILTAAVPAEFGGLGASHHVSLEAQVPGPLVVGSMITVLIGPPVRDIGLETGDTALDTALG